MALPSGKEALLGPPLWGLAMSLSALAGLYLRNRADTSHLAAILVLFFCGGALAWLPALYTARGLTPERAIETRGAALFLCLTMFTIAATAFLFAMQYRLFFARWHAPFGTRTWVYQFIFTSLGATYQFVVMGVGLFLPLGLLALAAASIWLALKDARRQR